jgi:ABC-type uncharacterized transport system
MADRETSPTGFTRGLRWLGLLNLLVGSLAVAAVLVMVNYLADGHFKRFRWNNRASFTLSPRTLQLVHDLTNDVTVTLFFQQSHQFDVYDMASAMLNEYRSANPQHIHLVKLDEERDFSEAKELLDRLHLTGSNRRNFVAFESPGHAPKTFTEDELVHLDFSDIGQHNIRRDAFNGEKFFSSYLFGLLYPIPKKAYFLTGHGERDPGDPTGQRPAPGKDAITNLADILKVEANCDWDLLSLRGTNTIPADCQLLIIASPSKQINAYSRAQLTNIQDYLLNHNGRLLALLDVDMGLNLLLNSYGIRVETNFIVKELNPDYRITENTFESRFNGVTNSIVTPLIAMNLPLHMVSPHPVYNIAGTNSRPDSPQIEFLVGTTPDATDGVRKGVFPLIATVQHGVLNDRNGTRLVIAGDADFLDDQMIDDAPSANHYFALQALNWLLQRPEAVLSTLPSRPIVEYKINMTEAQSLQTHWLFLAVMPGSVLFLGFLVWLRRRS